MNKVLELHKNVGYFIKIEQLQQINGIKISFPAKNIDSNDIKSAVWKIYESEKDKLTIYKNGKCVKKVDVSEKFHRVLIMADFCCMCEDYNIDNKLSIVFKENKITEDEFNLYDLTPQIKKSKKESQLADILRALIENKDASYLAKQSKLEYETEQLEEIFDIGGY